MRVDEALAALRKAFPGKRVYVQAMKWLSEDGTADDHFEFSLCVYEGRGKGENVSTYSRESLGKAVELALEQTPGKTEAAEMFGEPEPVAVSPL